MDLNIKTRHQESLKYFTQHIAYFGYKILNDKCGLWWSDLGKILFDELLYAYIWSPLLKYQA